MRRSIYNPETGDIKWVSRKGVKPQKLLSEGVPQASPSGDAIPMADPFGRFGVEVKDGYALSVDPPLEGVPYGDQVVDPATGKHRERTAQEKTDFQSREDQKHELVRQKHQGAVQAKLDELKGRGIPEGQAKAIIDLWQS